ncbi:MAG: NAD+ synthase [Alphaproteobacteria bacterium]|nr:MAG: NAD+ synthase [Alphaproteobacteria bacterium]
MTDTLKIMLAQLNPTVGDLAGNVARAREARAMAAEAGADLLMFSELFLTGYPPEDLVLKPAFQDDVRAMTQELARETAEYGPALLIGCPWVEGGKLYNAVLLLEGGEVKAARYKHHLPNYGVFDEIRVFHSADLQGPFNFRGVKIGAPICEDIWYPDVVECLEETGAEILLVPNGSPFEAGKHDLRLQHAIKRVTESGLPLVYLNQVGGQDELVFDGSSFVLNKDLSLPSQMPSWREALVMTEWTRGEEGWTCAIGERAAFRDNDEAIYQACVLGLKDYVEKNRFPGVIIGLSGGIDSALTAAMAVDALGPSRVHCVMMPSVYTSEESLSDAAACAKMLGAHLDNISIKEPVAAFGEVLAPHFEGTNTGVTEENIQSRSRGLILMALSNKLGYMVLTTGNKSEVSVGYATLYGDMAGGFNPLKDLYKMQVFALSRWRNANKPEGALGPDGPVMPVTIIDKPPSAELRPDQKDEDSLPPYEALDDILECLVENEMPVDEIVKRGHDLATVKRVEHLLYVAEYKRRQAAPGVKIGRKSFGRDRRYPITNGYRDADP